MTDRDVDWLPPSEREELFACDCGSRIERTHYEDCASLTCVEDDALLAHARVADDVIQELAEALRAAGHEHDEAHATDPCAGCFTEGLARAALARVDALTKETR